MKRRDLTSFIIALCCVAALAASPPMSAAKDKTADGSREYIEGTVVGIGGRLGGRTRPFTLIVNNFTTPDQVQQLNEALRSGGEEGLSKALSKMSAGRIAIGAGVGVTANAIIATPQAEGGTKITVLYERAAGFYELRRGTRSEDYRFGEAEIYLDQSGKGEGTFVPAAQIKLEKDGTWGVEDFGEFPARIMGLQVRR